MHRENTLINESFALVDGNKASACSPQQFSGHA